MPHARRSTPAIDTNPTFHDYTQLIRVSQRRITAAWHDLDGGTVHVTPTVAGQAAAGVRVWDLERSQRQWEEDLTLHATNMTDLERMTTRVNIWWAKQWRHQSALYRVRVLTESEQHAARDLIRRVPRAGFTCHPSEVPTHPDAKIVCEALAANGQVLVTHNLGTIRRNLINNWVVNHAAEFGHRNTPLIVTSDDWIKAELGGLETDESRARAARLALAAFWPENEDARPETVITDTANVCARMRSSPYADCLNEAEGALIEGSATPDGPAYAWVEQVRDQLPERMRAAEYAHPRYVARGLN